jgi:hypothetical protein
MDETVEHNSQVDIAVICNVHVQPVKLQKFADK